MMYGHLAKVLAVAAILEATLSTEARSDKERLRICPQNEEFGLCLECEGTCNEFYPTCTMGCEAVGCHCKRGFVRYGEMCVRPSDCPQNSLSGLLGGGAGNDYDGFPPGYGYGGDGYGYGYGGYYPNEYAQTAVKFSNK